MLYFIYRNTHYLIGGVRMKKLISVFLCAVLIVSVFSANAFAASPDTFHTDSLSCHTTEVAPCIEGSHFCSSCGMQGTSVASWPEYTYYYTYWWETLRCDNASSCSNYGKTWTILIMAVENISDEVESDTTTCNNS